MPFECAACRQGTKIDFHVPDEIWGAVVPERHLKEPLCLPCFDALAAEAGVSYRDSLKVRVSGPFQNQRDRSELEF